MEWDDAASSRWVEQRFPTLASRASTYQATVDAGFQRMQGATCAIVGVGRNVADYLPATIDRIERLGRRFADYSVFIYENDSSDCTPDILRAWSAYNDRVTIECEHRGDPVHPPLRCTRRAAAMAAYRARCQQYVRQHCPDIHYTCVVDLDLAGGWWEAGVAHTFGSDGWDFVGSQGVIVQRKRLNPNVALHYDTWAFRRHGSYLRVPGKVGNAMAWQRGDVLQPVYSCFGGLGFYRTEAFLAGEYSGEDCEHVTLHRSMRARGYDRHFLNPNQLVLYGRKPKRWDKVAIAFDRVSRGVRQLLVPAEAMAKAA